MVASEIIAYMVTGRPMGYNQWRILMVFKVFSEHPGNSKKIIFPNFL